MSADAGSVNPEAVRKSEGQGADRTLEALLERVKGLDGPYRVTDDEIEWALSEWRNLGGWWREHKVSGVRERFTYSAAPAYTASIDAVVALCERVEPDHGWEVHRDDDHYRGPLFYWASVSERKSVPEYHRSRGATPALALLAALLSALIQSRSPSLVGE